jgi:uncharacterized protein YhhL (DUF1145 family)
MGVKVVSRTLKRNIHTFAAIPIILHGSETLTLKKRLEQNRTELKRLTTLKIFIKKDHLRNLDIRNETLGSEKN